MTLLRQIGAVAILIVTLAAWQSRRNGAAAAATAALSPAQSGHFRVASGHR
jgi:hypothetical protein